MELRRPIFQNLALQREAGVEAEAGAKPEMGEPSLDQDRDLILVKEKEEKGERGAEAKALAEVAVVVLQDLSQNPAQFWVFLVCLQLQEKKIWETSSAVTDLFQSVNWF